MRAWLHIQLSDRDGSIVDERRAHNTVMESGARLVAALFSGTGTPITHMFVGTSGASSDDPNVTALRNEPEGEDVGLRGEVAAAIPTEAFSARLVPERRVVQVRVRATLPADAAVGTIREAGLVSRGDDGDVLYNRVVFAAIDKGDDHELTLFWEVDFPFGDLQWLA